MARIRSVHPGICTSEDIAELSAELERTFVRLWTHCDDEGRCRDNPRLIKAALYPLLDEQTVEVIDGELAELATAGRIIRYAVDGVNVLQVLNWGAFQKPQRPTPSKLPSPPTPPGPPDGGIVDPSAMDRGGIAEASRQEKEGRGEGVRANEPERDLTLVPPPGSSADADGPDEFDRWWTGYPRKVDKATARTAYAKARRRVDAVTLTDRLTRQCAVWRREGRPRDKIPHASTWLNRDRWADDDLIAETPDRRADVNGWVER